MTKQLRSKFGGSIKAVLGKGLSWTSLENMTAFGLGTGMGANGDNRFYLHITRGTACPPGLCAMFNVYQD